MMAVRKIGEPSQAKSRLTGVYEAVYLVYALARPRAAFTHPCLDILVQMHLYLKKKIQPLLPNVVKLFS